MAEHTSDASLGEKRVLVIDDDEVARNLIANHLRKMGVGDVVLKEDGDAGWQAIQADRFDVVVLDWKLPKLSGLAFFNRIRAVPHYRMTPILVVSGFLEKTDFRLLQEFPATMLMEKPFTVVRFQNRIEELVRETEWYGQNVALVDTLLNAVSEDGRKAEQLLKQVIKVAPNPIPLAILVARRMVHAGLLKGAQSVLEAVLKIDEHCVPAIGELGKTLHLLGDHQRALDVLRLAHKLSPQHLQRLCLLGEVELNLKKPGDARACFLRALEIDASDAKARAGLVIATNMASFLGEPDRMQVPKTFASLLNTMGITFVRNQQFLRGIEQYQAAMVFLHAPEDSARVAFNLGLGYLRWGKPDAALPWFKKSERLAPKGFGKSAAYVRQLLANGGGAEIDEARPPASGSLQEATVSDDASSQGGSVIPFPAAKPTSRPARSTDDGGREQVVDGREDEAVETIPSPDEDEKVIL